MKSWAERYHLLKGSFPSSLAIKIVRSKHVVLIMQIINIIINMDNIRQESLNECPIFKLNNGLKKTSLNTKFGTHESMILQALKK